MNREITLLLPSTGEPLITYCFLQNFKKYQHLISNVFLSVDTMGSINYEEFKSIESYLIKEYSKINNLKYSINYAIGQHGLNVNILLSNYEQEIKENILLMEEDDYILNLNKFEFEINNFLDQNYDVAGVGRGSCTEYLIRLVGEYIKSRNDLYLDNVLPNNQNYLNFWPTLFLIKKRHLLNSTKHFTSYRWNKDEVFKMGDKEWILEETCHGDTFVKLSTEIYQNTEVKKIKLFGETYRSCLEDAEFIPNIVNTSIDFHVGALSEILAYKLWGSTNEDFKNNLVKRVSYITSIGSNRQIVENYRRCCLLRQMLYSIKTPSDFDYYNNYENNISLMIDVFEKSDILNYALNECRYEKTTIRNDYKMVFDKIY